MFCTGNDSLVYVAQLYCKADKNLFHRPTRSANIVETGHEVRFQAFLVVQTALLLSITYYLFTRTTNSGNDTFLTQICQSPYQKIYENKTGKAAEMYAYNILWNGRHGIWETFWSANNVGICST